MLSSPTRPPSSSSSPFTKFTSILRVCFRLLLSVALLRITCSGGTVHAFIVKVAHVRVAQAPKKIGTKLLSLADIMRSAHTPHTTNSHRVTEAEIISAYGVNKKQTDDFARQESYTTHATQQAAARASHSVFVPQRRYLLFSQAGDHHVIDLWLKEEREVRNFDVIVGYYGDGQLAVSSESEGKGVDYSFCKKGYKLPSLAYLHMTLLPGVLCSYDAVFVLDCDILISTEQINEMFMTRELYGLDMMAPSQNTTGKVSYPVLRSEHPRRKLRYVSFAETNSPLFSSEFLRHLLNIQRGLELLDWGFDFLWSSMILNEGRRAAIADWITMTNPYQEKGHHEIGGTRRQYVNQMKWRMIQHKRSSLAHFGIHEKSTLIASSGNRFIDLDYPGGLPKTWTPTTKKIRYVDERDNRNITAVGDPPSLRDAFDALQANPELP